MSSDPTGSETDSVADSPSDPTNERTDELTEKSDARVNQETAVDVCARIKDSMTGGAMTTPHYEDATVRLFHGDCLDVLHDLPDASVDAVVTDPPYGLEFMGKAWDKFGRTGPVSFEATGANRAGPRGTGAASLDGHHPRWSTMGPAAMRAFGDWCLDWTAECLRVLKPGGHLLAFGGTRTWHRLACAVEDAGFEVRDSIAWLYGSGFSKGGLMGNKPGLTWCECGENPLPYNHAGNPDLRGLRSDIHPPTESRGKGEDADVLAPMQREAARAGVGEARPQGSRGLVAGGRGVSAGEDVGRAEPGMGGRHVPRAGEGLPDGAPTGSPESASEWVRGGTPAGDGVADRTASDAARGSASHQRRPSGQQAGEPEAVPGSHEPLDDGARRDGLGCARCGGLPAAFRGFSTTLKPAFEPVVVARKPLSSTVAGNVLAYGTGALNIDGCRIATDEDRSRPPRTPNDGIYGHGKGADLTASESNPAGRWPANVVLDDAQAAALDQQSGELTSGANPTRRGADGDRTAYGDFAGQADANPQRGTDTGGASRFFYTAKADAAERVRVDGIAHPTVKPLALMRWLVRLVTPPGGTVLEPFAGSGTTVEACILEGFQCVAIEREADYLPLILQRIHRRRDPLAAVRASAAPDDDLGLFGLLDEDGAA